MTEIFEFSTIYSGPLGGEELRPKDNATSARRALFYVTALAFKCNELLREGIAKWRSVSKADSSIIEFDQNKYKYAVKEILGVSIWLTYLHNRVEATPDWFQEFITYCNGAADELYKEPTTTEISKRYNWDSPLLGLCSLLAVYVGKELNLSDSEEALKNFANLVSNAGKDRAQLLAFALSQPIEVLDKQIKDYAAHTPG